MISFLAPAKINLYLHVLNKLDTGYHTLDSLVIFSDFSDQVDVWPSNQIELEIKGPFATALTNGSQNIVLRAAKELQAYLGVSFGAKIVLNKKIPVAAGLGGGSSDAAATIKALLKLWRVDFEKRDISVMALELGADVPVCLFSQPSFVGGVGEKIYPILSFPPVHIVLINPRIEVPTGQIFSNYKGPFNQSARFEIAPKTAEELVRFLKDKGSNDLVKPAIEIAPEIEMALNFLNSDVNCKFANMSGSGATCFGIYLNFFHANEAFKKCKKAYPNWWAVSTKLVHNKKYDSSFLDVS